MLFKVTRGWPNIVRTYCVFWYERKLISNIEPNCPSYMDKCTMQALDSLWGWSILVMHDVLSIQSMWNKYTKFKPGLPGHTYKTVPLTSLFSSVGSQNLITKFILPLYLCKPYKNFESGRLVRFYSAYWNVWVLHYKLRLTLFLDVHSYTVNSFYLRNQC